MRLYHSFPGFLGESRKVESTVPPREYDNVGLAILDSILNHGLLLVPESFPVLPSPFSPRLDKKELISRREAMFNLLQIRACFTLSTLEGLSHDHRSPYERKSHAALFGKFAIGINPNLAPMLGILPVIYYNDYRVDPASRSPYSLSPYLVDRLIEIRNIISILSHIKVVAHPELPYSLDKGKLIEMGVIVHNEAVVERLLELIDRDTARLVFRYFDTDRVPMCSLVESIDMLMSLFQTTDSRTRNRSLAYYEQREWRLIRHSTQANAMYSLGQRSWVDREDDEITIAKKYSVRKSLKPILDYAIHLREAIDFCWIIEGVDKYHFRDYIDEIVVPPNCKEKATNLVRRYHFKNGPPRVLPLPQGPGMRKFPWPFFNRNKDVPQHKERRVRKWK